MLWFFSEKTRLPPNAWNDFETKFYLHQRKKCLCRDLFVERLFRIECSFSNLNFDASSFTAVMLFWGSTKFNFHNLGIILNLIEGENGIPNIHGTLNLIRSSIISSFHFDRNSHYSEHYRTHCPNHYTNMLKFYTGRKRGASP